MTSTAHFKIYFLKNQLILLIMNINLYIIINSLITFIIMKITAIFATYSNVGLYQSSLSELELLDLVVRLAFHGSL